MQFIKHDLGQLMGSEIVEITLTSVAYVRLMDSDNFLLYRSGRLHKSYSGHYKSSPVLLNIPNPGHWYVAVDLAGYPGKVGSSARVLSGEAVSG